MSWTLAERLRLCAGSLALALCGALASFSVGAATQPAEAIASPLAEHRLLLDVVRAGPRLVAVGDRGHVLYSDDQGASWTQARVPTRQMLTAVYFIDAQTGWAVGHDAQILVSHDGGASWTLQFEDREREAPLLDVWFADAHRGFAVGAYGALLRSDDGGAHWEDIGGELDNEDGYHLNALAEAPGAGLFVVGEMGVIFRSEDGGDSWQRLDSPYEGSLFGVLGDGQGGVLVFGLRGHLFRSDDAGASWQRLPLQDAQGQALESGLAGGARLADGSLVVVGHAGSVLRSRDGRQFSLYSRADRLSLSAAVGNDEGDLILVGQGGIHLATDSGADLGQ